MNHVVLIGRLTKAPVIRVSADGKAMGDFTLAVDRSFSKAKEADFIRIVVFGKQAENCGKYLKKGSPAAVMGRIQTGRYEDQYGITRYTFDVVADRVEFVSSRCMEEEQEPLGRLSETEIPQGFMALDDDEDDVPF